MATDMSKRGTSFSDASADQSGYAPGSFGCHEALHMASVLMMTVDRELCEHPAVQQNKEWAALADKARQALYELYQKIGARHL